MYDNLPCKKEELIIEVFHILLSYAISAIMEEKFDFEEAILYAMAEIT